MISPTIRSRLRQSDGVAIIMVVMVVALASIIVINLAYSTYLSARLNSSVQKGLQAEYLLKSALNVARVLLAMDITPDDKPDDLWVQFVDGVPIPSELLGLDLPNVQIELEIRPEDAKLPFHPLLSGVNPDREWMELFVRLFEGLGFENDKQVDQTGLFPNREFGPEELVANLIDFIDQDSESLNDSPYVGIESQLPRDYYPAQGSRIERLGQLAQIPGFTPLRVQRLWPLVNTLPVARVNLNAASAEIIKSLDPGMDDSLVEKILLFRSGLNGPFVNSALESQLRDVVGVDLAGRMRKFVEAESGQGFFSILAKVDYSTSIFFLKALVYKSGQGQLPRIESLELY